MSEKLSIGYESLSSEDEDYNLWLLLIKTRRVLVKAREKEMSQYGFTSEQSGIIYVIKHIGDKATPAEISRQTLRAPQTISALIDRMEKRGLVKKVKKKNVVKVTLTSKGEQAYSQSTKRQSIHVIMSTLSAEEHQQLRTCLRKLHDKALEILFPQYPWIA